MFFKICSSDFFFICSILLNVSVSRFGCRRFFVVVAFNLLYFLYPFCIYILSLRFVSLPICGNTYMNMHDDGWLRTD